MSSRAAVYSILLCSMAAGCAGQQQLQAPRIEVFAKAQRPTVEMKGPVSLPLRPAAKQVHDADGDYFAFTPEAARQLVVRDQVCQANTEIAAHCAAGFNAMRDSYGLLLHEAQLVEGQHNYLGERWAVAEEELRQRDRDLLIERWLTRILLVAVAISAAD